MKSITRLVIIIIVAGIFPACKKGIDAGKMIPKDALVVLHLNTKSLSSKITWNEITQTSWYKEVYNDTAAKPWVKKIMDNPDNCGIDFKAGLYAFAQKNSGVGQVVFEGTIKDANAFELFNKNMAADAVTTKDGDLKTLILKNESVVCWNDGKFAYIFNTPYMPDVAMNADTLQHLLYSTKFCFVLIYPVIIFIQEVKQLGVVGVFCFNIYPGRVYFFNPTKIFITPIHKIFRHQHRVDPVAQSDNIPGEILNTSRSITG